MDPITLAIALALAEGLKLVGKKLVDGTVEAALEPAKEQLKKRVQKPYKDAEKDAKLQKAVEVAVASVGAPVDDEEGLETWARDYGLARLRAEGAASLRQRFAKGVAAFGGTSETPSEDLLMALGWPKNRVEELATLLRTLRAELAGHEDYRDLIAYFDRATALNLQASMEHSLQLLSGAVVTTKSGEPLLQVAVKELGLSEEDYWEIDARYRAHLIDLYREHGERNLSQVSKTVRMPLLDMYHELGLVAGRSEEDRQHEVERMLASEAFERLALQAEHADRRITTALAEYPRVVILGKPGSGKSLTLRYIALLLAHGQPGAERLGLAQPYLPLLVRLAQYAQELARNENLALEAFLRNYIQEYFPGTDPTGKLLQLALEQGCCMLLLDGLDEVGLIGETVRSGKTLRARVLEEVQRLADTRCREGHGNRLVITSRLEGYGQGDLANCVDLELSPLRVPDEVKEFLLRWFTAFERSSDEGLSAEGASERARTQVEGLLPAIELTDSVKLLATNPLLLTILAIIYETGSALPQRRVEVYAKVTDTLIVNWRQSQITEQRKLFDQIGLSASELKHLMATLAFWLRENKPGGAMPVDQWRAQLSARLTEKYVASEADARPYVDAFIHHAIDETGLVSERAPGQLGFFHLTVEEYLAALRLSTLSGDERNRWLDVHWPDPYWREVILLCVGELNLSNPDAVPALLGHLLMLDVDSPELAGQPVALAGRALVDLAQGRRENMLHQNMRRALRVVAQDLEPETNQPRKAPTVTLRTRFEAAQALDALGWLPDDLHQFVHIPAGEDFPEFWMGRYPVTNAQYGRFLTSGDFLDPALWHDFPNYDENSQPIKKTTGDAAWEWLTDAGDGVPKVIAPRYWGDPRFGSSRPSAPVVGVSWWEANAYCRWLERHWGEREEGAANAGMAGVAVRLPTEKEWLKAAGGDENGRYPWDEPGTATNLNDEDAIMARANVYESGLGSTTPVGMFPRGRSHPYGLEDMAGNVLEWQANVYSDNSSVRALRGGSWDDGADFARCALRNRARPDGRGSGVGFRVAVSPSR